MKNEMVLSTKDLNAVGINTQLTSNDLIEVVAQDIYDKFMGNINDLIARSKEVRKRWADLFDAELEVMRKELVKNKLLVESEEVNRTYGKDKTYWNNSIDVETMKLEERDKGTKVIHNSHSYDYPIGSKVNVKLSITVDDYDNDNKVSLEGISGVIEVRTSKKFYKIISVPNSVFKAVITETKEFNSEVQSVMKALPANGLLSVERFTREARVKMNKKIISGQSPEFRQKMSQLFNIKL